MSIQATVIKNYMRLQRILSPKPEKYDVTRARKENEALSSMFKPLVSGQVEQDVVNGIVAEWLTPPQTIPGRILLYLHGGYYNAGSAQNMRPIAMNTAHAARAKTLSIDYRLAPEHPYPAGLDDAVSVYKWLIQNSHLPGDILLAGDSAGGGLALCLLLKLREEGLPLPAGAICYSPWIDMTLSGESYAKNASLDVMLDMPSFRQSVELYLGDTDPHIPLVSPVFGELHNLPPILIQVGSDEMLLSDAETFAQKARDAGSDVTLEIWQGMQHEWQFVASVLPEGKQAIEHVRQFVDTNLQ